MEDRDSRFSNCCNTCIMQSSPPRTQYRKVLVIFQVGKLSTGDSLDMSPQDEASISANDATIKDMEVVIAKSYFGTFNQI